LGMSLAAPTLAMLLNDKWTKKLMGAALILLAVLSVALMVVRMQGQGAHRHMSSNFGNSYNSQLVLIEPHKHNNRI